MGHPDLCDLRAQARTCLGDKTGGHYAPSRTSPAAMIAAGPVRIMSVPGPFQSTRCVPPGACDGDGGFSAAKCNHGGCRSAGSGAGGGGGADAALENADLDFVGADQSHEENVDLLWEIFVKADFFAELLPAARVRAKIRVVDHDDEMRIAHGDVDAVDDGLIGERDLHLAGSRERPCWRRCGTGCRWLRRWCRCVGRHRFRA